MIKPCSHDSLIFVIVQCSAYMVRTEVLGGDLRNYKCCQVPIPPAPAVCLSLPTSCAEPWRSAGVLRRLLLQGGQLRGGQHARGVLVP